MVSSLTQSNLEKNSIFGEGMVHIHDPSDPDGVASERRHRCVLQPDHRARRVRDLMQV
jgi:hypothetical protein